MITDTRAMLELEDNRLDLDEGEDWFAQLLHRAARRAGQMGCGITGHNVLLHYEPTRLSLQCTTCGYESPGWEVGKSGTSASREVGPARVAGQPVTA